MTEEAFQLRKENQEQREALQQTQELLRVALARTEELEKQKTPPTVVKTNAKKAPGGEKKARHKRDAKHNHGRLHATPTQIVEHRIVACPPCDLRLGGMSLAQEREVIEIARPEPVQVIPHRIFSGPCASPT